MIKLQSTLSYYTYKSGHCWNEDPSTSSNGQWSEWHCDHGKDPLECNSVFNLHSNCTARSILLILTSLPTSMQLSEHWPQQLLFSSLLCNLQAVSGGFFCHFQKYGKVHITAQLDRYLYPGFTHTANTVGEGEVMAM